MDEVSWLECRDARPMMKILASEAFITERKGRLIVDAVMTHWWDRRGTDWEWGKRYPTASKYGVGRALEVIQGHDLPDDVAENANLLRDMVGNPYDPVTLTKPPSHQAFSLARAAYDHRRIDWSLDPVRLAILADALEEEGCDCEELLQSLRGWKVCQYCLGTGFTSYTHGEFSNERSGSTDTRSCDRWQKITHPRYRGQWALDLVLGKE